MLKKDFSYPKITDKNLQSKLYKKREFYYHKVEARDILKTWDDIQNYREKICFGEFELAEQQKVIKNYISLYTPYNGLLVMHGTGTGKTCGAIAIAEQFKEVARRYDTKIYVLVPGPNLKENFKYELGVNCTNETYLKNRKNIELMTNQEQDREKRKAISQALQFYKIMSYKSFYRKVLGEKIQVKKIEGEKQKKTYRKTDTGDFEREVVIDKIENLNNTVIIVDEAHNFTGNERGDALKKIMSQSENCKLILLSATPMKNLADDIIDMLNFLRPENDQINRDDLFTGERNHEMKLKPDGLKILQEKANGYISFYRGNMPYTFADKIDKGVIPKGLLFTPLILCNLLPFQEKTYLETLKFKEDIDALDRKSNSAANFVIPNLNKENNDVIGNYGLDGLTILDSNLKNDAEKLNKFINKTILNNQIDKNNINEIIKFDDKKKNLYGLILKKNNLKNFSSKFYQCLINLEKLIDKQAGTAFIYSNVVKIGIELFSMVLLENGYLEFDETNVYNIKNNTLDAITGLTFENFIKKFNKDEFKPATFILVTGGSEDDNLPEEKQRIIKSVFNDISNVNGSKIKLILGSPVMNEGVTLENVSQVHILDVHYNLGRIDQIIGRAIRHCKHKNVVTKENPFPQVKVYRYAVDIKNKQSSEIDLYQKAELKYLLVKKVERALKEIAIDCPLLYNGNVFPEDLEKYKNCSPPTRENVEQGKTICPAMCDFERCDYKCKDPELDKFLDKKGYRDLDKKEIDYNTFNDDLAIEEINNIIDKIKGYFKINTFLTFNQIKKKIEKDLTPHQKNLFDINFIDMALDRLTPVSENDFNNFKDTVYDKYNTTGYLIQRNEFFIFQPFEETQKLPMIYRETFQKDLLKPLNISNYIENKFPNLKIESDETKIISKKKKKYDFDSNIDYYNNREENDIVGIIDLSKNEDVFKLRKKRPKSFDKKRGVGLQSLKGAVCNTSNERGDLLKILKKLDVDIKEYLKVNRLTLCDLIKNKLIELEKYQTGKNKKTFIMIPANHPTIPFPLNLEDRAIFLRDEISNLTKKDINETITKKNKEIILSFKNTSTVNPFKKEIEKLGFKLDSKGIYSIVLT